MSFLPPEDEDFFDPSWSSPEESAKPVPELGTPWFAGGTGERALPPEDNEFFDPAWSEDSAVGIARQALGAPSSPPEDNEFFDPAWSAESREQVGTFEPQSEFAQSQQRELEDARSQFIGATARDVALEGAREASIKAGMQPTRFNELLLQHEMAEEHSAARKSLDMDPEGDPGQSPPIFSAGYGEAIRKHRESLSPHAVAKRLISKSGIPTNMPAEIFEANKEQAANLLVQRTRKMLQSSPEVTNFQTELLMTFNALERGLVPFAIEKQEFRVPLVMNWLDGQYTGLDEYREKTGKEDKRIVGGRLPAMPNTALITEQIAGTAAADFEDDRALARVASPWWFNQSILEYPGMFAAGTIGRIHNIATSAVDIVRAAPGWLVKQAATASPFHPSMPAVEGFAKDISPKPVGEKARREAAMVRRKKLVERVSGPTQIMTEGGELIDVPSVTYTEKVAYGKPMVVFTAELPAELDGDNETRAIAEEVATQQSEATVRTAWVEYMNAAPEHRAGALQRYDVTRKFHAKFLESKGQRYSEDWGRRGFLTEISEDIADTLPDPQLMVYNTWEEAKAIVTGIVPMAWSAAGYLVGPDSGTEKLSNTVDLAAGMIGHAAQRYWDYGAKGPSHMLEQGLIGVALDLSLAGSAIKGAFKMGASRARLQAFRKVAERHGVKGTRFMTVDQVSSALKKRNIELTVAELEEVAFALESTSLELSKEVATEEAALGYAKSYRSVLEGHIEEMVVSGRVLRKDARAMQKELERLEAKEAKIYQKYQGDPVALQNKLDEMDPAWIAFVEGPVHKDFKPLVAGAIKDIRRTERQIAVIERRLQQEGAQGVRPELREQFVTAERSRKIALRRLEQLESRLQKEAAREGPGYFKGLRQSFFHRTKPTAGPLFTPGYKQSERAQWLTESRFPKPGRAAATGYIEAELRFIKLTDDYYSLAEKEARLVAKLHKMATEVPPRIVKKGQPVSKSSIQAQVEKRLAEREAVEAQLKGKLVSARKQMSELEIESLELRKIMSQHPGPLGDIKQAQILEQLARGRSKKSGWRNEELHQATERLREATGVRQVSAARDLQAVAELRAVLMQSNGALKGLRQYSAMRDASEIQQLRASQSGYTSLIAKNQSQLELGREFMREARELIQTASVSSRALARSIAGKRANYIYNPVLVRSSIVSGGKLDRGVKIINFEQKGKWHESVLIDGGNGAVKRVSLVKSATYLKNRTPIQVALDRMDLWDTAAQAVHHFTNMVTPYGPFVIVGATMNRLMQGYGRATGLGRFIGGAVGAAAGAAVGGPAGGLAGLAFGGLAGGRMPLTKGVARHFFRDLDKSVPEGVFATLRSAQGSVNELQFSLNETIELLYRDTQVRGVPYAVARAKGKKGKGPVFKDSVEGRPHPEVQLGGKEAVENVRMALHAESEVFERSVEIITKTETRVIRGETTKVVVPVEGNKYRVRMPIHEQSGAPALVAKFTDEGTVIPGSVRIDPTEWDAVTYAEKQAGVKSMASRDAAGLRAVAQRRGVQSLEQKTIRQVIDELESMGAKLTAEEITGMGPLLQRWNRLVKIKEEFLAQKRDGFINRAWLAIQ